MRLPEERAITRHFEKISVLHKNKKTPKGQDKKTELAGLCFFGEERKELQVYFSFSFFVPINVTSCHIPPTLISNQSEKNGHLPASAV